MYCVVIREEQTNAVVARPSVGIVPCVAEWLLELSWGWSYGRTASRPAQRYLLPILLRPSLDLDFSHIFWSGDLEKCIDMAKYQRRSLAILILYLTYLSLKSVVLFKSSVNMSLLHSVLLKFYLSTTLIQSLLSPLSYPVPPPGLSYRFPISGSLLWIP